MNTSPALLQRFFVLDAVRGLAALSVVFWHWQNFFYSGTVSASLSRHELPLYPIFFVLYECGYMAVDFFFVLSGFIFYWLYSDVLAEKKVSAKEFVILRFSRLYPLHFITLLIVAVGQMYLSSQYGGTFVYSHNDVYHFILNIFFASHWGFQAGHSFNAPVWSVSIEILLYTVFFLLLSHNKRSLVWIVMIILLGMGLRSVYAEAGRGLVGFFIGGVVYQLFDYLTKNRLTKFLLYGMGLGLMTVIAVVTVEVRFHGIESLLRQVLTTLLPSLMPKIPLIINRLQWLFAVVILFPLSVLWCAVMEAYYRFRHPPQFLVFLGEISYSSYLLHFPLQLFCIILCFTFHPEQALFLSPLTLVLFLAILVILSHLSYRYFELPLQKYIRYTARECLAFQGHH